MTTGNDKQLQFHGTSTVNDTHIAHSEIPQVRLLFACGHSKLIPHKIFHNFDRSTTVDVPPEDGTVEACTARTTCTRSDCQVTEIDVQALNHVTKIWTLTLADRHQTLISWENELSRTKAKGCSLPTSGIRDALHIAQRHINQVQRWDSLSMTNSESVSTYARFSMSFIAAIDCLESTEQELSELARSMSELMTCGQTTGKYKPIPNDYSRVFLDSEGEFMSKAAEEYEANGKAKEKTSVDFEPDFSPNRGRIRITPSMTLQDTLVDNQPNASLHNQNYIYRQISQIQGYFPLPVPSTPLSNSKKPKSIAPKPSGINTSTVPSSMPQTGPILTTALNPEAVDFVPAPLEQQSFFHPQPINPLLAHLRHIEESLTELNVIAQIRAS